MDAMFLLMICAQFLFLTAPALWITATIIRDMPAENRRDKELIAKQKLSRAAKLAAGQVRAA